MKNTIKVIILKIFSILAILVLVVTGMITSKKAIDITTYLEENKGTVFVYRHEYREYENGFHEWVPVDGRKVFVDESELIEFGICIIPIAIFGIAYMQIGYEIVWFKTHRKEENRD